MSHFLQLHTLTAYPAANLNRDDSGRPKTMVFGGAERLRISSQSLKRAYRTSATFAEAVGDAIGVRSERTALTLIEALMAKGLDEAEAMRRAEAVYAHDRLSKMRRGTGVSEQLVHLAPNELARMEGLADRLLETAALPDREMLVLQDQPRAADIAMFGRMLADNPDFSVAAAVQVAHAFSTHRAWIEDDFYTAADDLASRPGGHRGAAFMGVNEFGAGLFYGYICVHLELLLENLAHDQGLAAAALAGLVAAAATTSPAGRQNSFASRAKASYALLEIGETSPRTLANAFLQPVGERERETDFLTNSIGRLQEMRDAFVRSYDEAWDVAIELDVTRADAASLQDLLQAAKASLRL